MGRTQTHTRTVAPVPTLTPPHHEVAWPAATPTDCVGCPQEQPWLWSLGRREHHRDRDGASRVRRRCGMPTRTWSGSTVSIRLALPDFQREPDRVPSSEEERRETPHSVCSGQPHGRHLLGRAHVRSTQEEPARSFDDRVHCLLWSHAFAWGPPCWWVPLAG